MLLPSIHLQGRHKVVVCLGLVACSQPFEGQWPIFVYAHPNPLAFPKISVLLDKYPLLGVGMQARDSSQTPRQIPDETLGAGHDLNLDQTKPLPLLG